MSNQFSEKISWKVYIEDLRVQYPIVVLNSKWKVEEED